MIALTDIEPLTCALSPTLPSSLINTFPPIK